MEKTNIIKYGSRTFSEIKTDLIAYIKQAYPEIFKDFTDSSVGSMLIDVNAGVTNNLSYNTDRVFQETQLEYAQQRASILNIAKNLGFNIPPKRPSVSVVDFTVTIPVLGSGPDSAYYPKLSAGAEVIGAGQSFETSDEIDWSSPLSSLGNHNRSIIPNFDSNGIIQNYSVTKREIVVNGKTTIFRKVINDNEVKPFLSITLPDQNVIEIDKVILVDGLVDTPENTDWINPSYIFYEVDYLAQQRVFVEMYNQTSTTIDNENLRIGRWIDVTKKFIKEYTPNGFCKLTFGSGDSDTDAFKEGMYKSGITNKEFLSNFLNNTALGEKLKSGYTLFVRYKTGGGSSTNVGANTLTQMGAHNLVCTGPIEQNKRIVIRSIRPTNPIPALGGNDGLSIEQIRQLIKYNYSSQNRDVTLNDYLLQIYKMPGKFGSPFRASVFKENNKVIISMLSIGNDGKLNNSSNSLLKENITEYLSQYRMVNDYVEVRDGKIFNLGFEIELFVEYFNDAQIANNVINIVSNYLNINKFEMNQNIFLGRMEREILNANGVINVVGIKVFNKVGGAYSSNVISQKIIDTTTGQIEIINNTIYSTPDAMFEIKFPQKDIKVILKRASSE